VGDSAAVERSLNPPLPWQKVLTDVHQSSQLHTSVADRLQQGLGGLREYPVEGGKVDLLTSSEIIEVSEVRGFKQAIGQVLYYSHVLNMDKYTMRVHLFNQHGRDVNQARIKSFAAAVDVEVTFE